MIKTLRRWIRRLTDPSPRAPKAPDPDYRSPAERWLLGDDYRDKPEQDKP